MAESHRTASSWRAAGEHRLASRAERGRANYKRLVALDRTSQSIACIFLNGRLAGRKMGRDRGLIAAHLLAIAGHHGRTHRQPSESGLRSRACARREIAAAYLAMRAGRAPAQSSLPGPLPDSCCRRPAARGRCDGGLTSVAPSPQRPPKSSILAGAASFGHGTGMRLGSGASRCRLAQHGGNHGQRRQRFSAVLLYGIIRHGDCPRGREPAHLMQPLCLATLLGQCVQVRENVAGD